MKRERVRDQSSYYLAVTASKVRTGALERVG